jgi:hypothetical protein
MDESRIKLFGNNYTIKGLKDTAGDLSTIAGVKPCALFDGPERGVFAVDVWTGPGSLLHFYMSLMVGNGCALFTAVWSTPAG